MVGHKREINALRFSPDGTKLVSVSGDRTAIVWRCSDGKKLATLSDHKNTITQVQFTADGRYIITAGGSVVGDEDFYIRMWDSDSYQFHQKFLPPNEGIKDLVVSKDNKWFVIAYAKVIVIWNRENSCIVTTLPHPDGVNSIALTEGKQLLVGCLSDGLYAWDIYEKSNSLTFLLRWFSGASQLYCRNACIPAKNLSDHNRELLLQRKATTENNVSQDHELIIDKNPNQSRVRKIYSANPALAAVLLALQGQHRRSPKDAEKFQQLWAKYGRGATEALQQITQTRNVQEKERNEEESLKEKNESDQSEKTLSLNAANSFPEEEDHNSEEMQQAIWMSLGLK